MERQTVWTGAVRSIGVSEVRQRHGQAQHPGGLRFDLVASKLRRPQTPARGGFPVIADREADAGGLPVLPLLATHLSFPEIGAALFLSPNTVKSQAISLYRKLGVGTRSQAVARSRELALLEG